MADKFVRLYPVNPRQKRTVASYMFRGQRYMGGIRPTWYKVSSKLAAELVELRQDHLDPYSPALFEVLDEDQKATTERREQEQYLAQIGALQGVISVPSDVKLPPTHDIRTEKEKAADGRAAALPPTREPVKSETKTASVVPDVAMQPEPEAKEEEPSSPFPEVPQPDVGPVTTKDVPKGKPFRGRGRRAPRLPGAALTAEQAAGDGDADGSDD